MGAITLSSPFSSQRVPTPKATTVSICFSTSHTRRIISSVRSALVLISTMAERTFSSRMSSLIVPVDTSLIKEVTGFFFSKETPAFASAQHIFWMSLKRAPIPAMPARGFVGNTRVGKGAPPQSRPSQLIRFESGCRANVRFGVETQPHFLKNLADGAHESRIQVLLAQAVVAGIALHALV